MKLTQDMVHAYVAGATDDGMTNWSERDDSKGLQALLDYLAPVRPIEPFRSSTSRELMQIRTVLSNAVNARARVLGAGGRDPEAHLMVRALDTVEEILRPWRREL